MSNKIINSIGATVTGLSLFILIILLCTLPIYWLWNWLAPIYFSFLPMSWLSIPYMHMLGLLGIIFLIKSIFFSKKNTDYSNLFKNKK